MPPTSAPAASESAKEYAQRQRGHILEAARQCFIEHGFEAASMSRIAAHAGVSTGLPYHYFHNKREIVLSLVHHQLQESHGIIDQLPATLDLAGSLAEAFARWAGGDLRETLHAGLHAEITALGTRDRQVAGSLRTADRESRRDIAGWLKRIADECGNDLDDPELQLRALMFQLLIDGLAARAAREPDLDRTQIDGLLQRMLPLITG